MNYLVLDLEVDGIKKRKRFCDPLEEEHKIIMAQVKRPNKNPEYKYSKSGLDRNLKIDFSEVDIIVGQNIKFDLLYIWKSESLQNFIKKGGQVWDTKIADFFLEGQNKLLRYSLNEISNRYNTKGKIEEVKDHFSKGKLFSEIPKSLAVKYGLQDVIVTEEVFLKQVLRAKKEGLLEIIQLHMNHYWSVMAIEKNGLYVNEEKLKRQEKIQRELVSNLKNELITEVSNIEWWGDDLLFDPNSSQHISALLFGGELPYIQNKVVNDEKGHPKRYKSGQRIGKIVTKKTKVFSSMKGLIKNTENTSATKNTGFYQTGTKVLQSYLQYNPIVQKILEYRKEYKLWSTYYSGFEELINPYSKAVHGEFTLIGTSTGRLACRNPNLQNLPLHFLDIFESRFKGGNIVTLDFSQLEVRLVALLSQDILLITEIKLGKDLHRANAALLYNKKETEVTPKERKLTKALTFGLLYGQSSKAMAITHKTSEDITKRFIETFYNKYVALNSWHIQMLNSVKEKAVVENGELVSKLRSPTNKYYMLRRYKTPEWKQKRGIDFEFSTTEPKNYPVQGLAADVVAKTIGELYLRYGDKKGVLFVNEIHDELVLDIKHREKCENIAKFYKNKMENISNKFIESLGFKVTVPMEVDYSIGINLKECKNS